MKMGFICANRGHASKTLIQTANLFWSAQNPATDEHETFFSRRNAETTHVYIKKKKKTFNIIYF